MRQVLPVQANDAEAFGYAREHDLFLITCNRDDFLALAADYSNPGMIILVRRRSRHAECGHLLHVINGGDPKIGGASGFATDPDSAWAK